MAKTAKGVSYQVMIAELEAILGELQGENVNVDTAVTLYERGLALTKQLEAYLTKTENHITKVSVTSLAGEQ